MKPNSQISRQHETSRSDKSPSLRRAHHPRIDCSFHASATEVRTAGGTCKVSRPIFAPGFRDLSKQFLGAETKRTYVAEVLFFAIIVAVSTWPIIPVMHALSQLPK